MIEIKNITKTILNSVNNDFSMTESFELLDIAFAQEEYYTVLLNDEMMDFFNIKFLYYKNNHHLKYDKYDCFFKKYTFTYDNGTTEIYFIYSIVLHDTINTFIVFNENVSVVFKKLVADLSKLDYMDYLNKHSIIISNQEKELLSKIDEYKYPVYDYEDTTQQSIEFCKDVLDALYKEQEVINNRKTFLLKEKLVRASKIKSQYHIKNVIKSLKSNKKAYFENLAKIYAFEDKLNYLQEPLLKAEDDFKFKSLLMTENDSLDNYENFNYDDYYKTL